MADEKNSFTVSEDDYKNAVFEDGGSLVIDLGGIEELKFEPLPRGIYDAIIDQWDYGPSKSSQKPMFTIVYSIDGGDYANRKLYQWLSFSPGAIRGTKAELMRIDPEQFAGQFNPAEIASSGKYLGKHIKIRVGIQDGQNGEPTNRVNVMPASANVAASQSQGQGNAQSGGFFNA